MRPGKLRLVVDTQTSGSFMRANVSRGPPRQAAHEGAAGGTHPTAAKISAAVLPFGSPGTGSAYTSAQTFWVAGTRYVGTFTCMSPEAAKSLAAYIKSSVFPPVQLPM